MTGTSPRYTLNSGVSMPALGLGVYQSTPEQTIGAVEAALTSGYRLIDTAAAYFNEHEVGEGLRRSGIHRADVFVQTKLWISDYGYDQTLRAFDASVERLGLDYVDLYLLHWPMPTEWERTVASYEAAERLLADGRVRAIGVSNFSPANLDALVARTEVVPAVNQVELHPFFSQRALREAHTRLGIVTQAWSPLGGVNVYAAKDPGAAKNPLTHPDVLALAAKYDKTPAQVVLRWHLEHGIAVIPKSVRPARIAENSDVFDFALAPQEVAAIDAIDTGVRGGPDPELVNTALFAMSVEDHYAAVSR
jgi:diketogulonate reductase-like aldo/keto reductase